MEEQRARQEAENASGGGTTATTEQGQAEKPETAASAGGAEEDPVLARALGKHENLFYTVQKFQDFSIIQILREINFGECRVTKSAVLTHLEVLNFDKYEFLHFLKADIYQINKIHSP